MSIWGPLPRLFDRVCQYWADNTAIIEDERSLSYRELGDWANRVANGLIDLNVGSDDRVGVLMPNCLEFIPSQYGVWKSGATLVQMQSRAGVDDLLFFCKESQASTVIYHEAFDGAMAKIQAELPQLRGIRLGDSDSPVDTPAYGDVFGGQSSSDPGVEVDEDSLAYVMFTSGTTGIPKGVLHTHHTWSHLAITAGLEYCDTRPGEVFGHIAPLTHFSQSFVMPTFIRGGTNVIIARPDMQSLLDGLMDAIEQKKVTAFAAVPTILYMLLDHPGRADKDLSSLRTMVYGGSPIAPQRLKQALEVFGPIFVQAYGGTEPGYTTCLRKEDHRVDTDQDIRRLSSAGRPMWHVDVSIQDDQDAQLPPGEVGEVCVRQEGQMTGYVDDSRNAEAMRGGWVHSGDLGYMDEDGYVYIVDRKKDMIVTGGLNVFPRQVEDILQEHPSVQQCAVIGIPDDKWGEAVTAIVVAEPHSDVTPEDLIQLVKERKGSVWAPKTVQFVEELPLNPSGKVDKKTLRAPYWAGRDRQVG